MCCTAQRRAALHNAALHCTTPRCTAQRRAALHNAALHCTIFFFVIFVWLPIAPRAAPP
jgi:hypothetical protein